MWALSIPVPFTKPVGAGAGGYFAPHIRAYMRRTGAPAHIGAMVAVKDRLNGAKNPLAHLHQPDITLEKVMDSPMLWDPVRYDETCPSSDGACAIVIGDEQIADQRVAEGQPVAWIHATSLRTEPIAYSGRDQVNPRAGRDAAAQREHGGGRVAGRLGALRARELGVARLPGGEADGPAAGLAPRRHAFSRRRCERDRAGLRRRVMACGYLDNVKSWRARARQSQCSRAMHQPS